MELSEKYIEKYLKQKATEYGYLCYKFVSPSNAGVCDRILISKTGVVYFIELKNKRGKLAPLQKKFIKDLEHNNQTVFVLDSKYKIDNLFGYIEGVDIYRED